MYTNRHDLLAIDLLAMQNFSINTQKYIICMVLALSGHLRSNDSSCTNNHSMQKKKTIIPVL